MVMPREQIEAVVRRLFEAHNQHNPALLEDLFASDYVNHAAAGGNRSADARRQEIAAYVAATPDLRTRIDDLMVVGDTAVVRWTTRATLTGARLQTRVGPVEPRGQKTEVSGVSVIRVSGDRIGEEWTYWDELSWLQQVGALPGPAN
jgi:steroid delta-isomerase-like uncharacterized protein